MLRANETEVAEPEEEAEPEAAAELEVNAMAIEEEMENEGIVMIEAVAAEPEAAAEPELENVRQRGKAAWVRQRLQVSSQGVDQKGIFVLYILMSGISFIYE